MSVTEVFIQCKWKTIRGLELNLEELRGLTCAEEEEEFPITMKNDTNEVLCLSTHNIRHIHKIYLKASTPNSVRL